MKKTTLAFMFILFGFALIVAGCGGSGGGGNTSGPAATGCTNLNDAGFIVHDDVVLGKKAEAIIINQSGSSVTVNDGYETFTGSISGNSMTLSGLTDAGSVTIGGTWDSSCKVFNGTASGAATGSIQAGLLGMGTTQARFPIGMAIRDLIEFNNGQMFTNINQIFNDVPNDLRFVYVRADGGATFMANGVMIDNHLALFTTGQFVSNEWEVAVFRGTVTGTSAANWNVLDGTANAYYLSDLTKVVGSETWYTQISAQGTQSIPNIVGAWNNLNFTIQGAIGPSTGTMNITSESNVGGISGVGYVQGFGTLTTPVVSNVSLGIDPTSNVGVYDGVTYNLTLVFDVTPINGCNNMTITVNAIANDSFISGTFNAVDPVNPVYCDASGTFTATR